MKQLLVDARMIHGMPHGIAKYVEAIALALKARRPNYEVTFLVTQETPKSSPVFQFKTILAHTKFLHPQEWFEIPRVLKNGKFNAFHSPSLSAYPYIPVPYLVTIHDLNHLHFGSWTQKLYYQSLLKYFARHAFQVTTVSEFSRKEISDWLGDTKRSIEIVQNGIEKVDVESLVRPITAPKEEYFLCIAGEKTHKNLSTLKSAYEIYRTQVSDPLPLVTKIPATADVKELMSWMRFAKACIFPSLYEGFGRAPVEAFIAGARILVSDIPPHREGLSTVTQESLIWVSPTNTEAWSDALVRVHHEAGFVSHRDEALRLQKQFLPEVILNQLDPIYQSMLLV